MQEMDEDRTRQSIAHTFAFADALLHHLKSITAVYFVCKAAADEECLPEPKHQIVPDQIKSNRCGRSNLASKEPITDVDVSLCSV